MSPLGELRRFGPTRLAAAIRTQQERNLTAWLALGYRPSTVKAAPPAGAAGPTRGCHGGSGTGKRGAARGVWC
jgi:hypothetical protein